MRKQKYEEHQAGNKKKEFWGTRKYNHTILFSNNTDMLKCNYINRINIRQWVASGLNLYQTQQNINMLHCYFGQPVDPHFYFWFLHPTPTSTRFSEKMLYTQKLFLRLISQNQLGSIWLPKQPPEDLKLHHNLISMLNDIPTSAMTVDNVKPEEFKKGIKRAMHTNSEKSSLIPRKNMNIPSIQ